MVTEKMIEALKPLADAVFNDNGDMTVQLPAITSEDCIKAYFAVRELSALSTDAEPVKTSRFGHHPEPAIDFCIEVEALEGHLFDAKHGIGKPGHEPRKVDDDFRRRVSNAMDFIVGGDQIAIAAKATLRALSAQVQEVAEEVKEAATEVISAHECGMLRQTSWWQNAAFLLAQYVMKTGDYAAPAAKLEEKL